MSSPVPSSIRPAFQTRSRSIFAAGISGNCSTRVANGQNKPAAGPTRCKTSQSHEDLNPARCAQIRMRRARMVRQGELTMAKLVQIKINQADYDQLKSINCNLCFAQKVNDVYTVVCQSISNYLPSTRFSWLPAYQAFGTNFFTIGVEAVVETNPVAIDFGQRATLDAAGVLKPAEDVGSSGVITFRNNYGPIHPGLIGTS